MRIGIACPYSWDVPGGVQQHIRDLAEALIDLGHEVSVIAPADDDRPLPPYVVASELRISRHRPGRLTESVRSRMNAKKRPSRVNAGAESP